MTKSNLNVVLITGASGGIGLATAKLFSERNWIVVGTVRGLKSKSSSVPKIHLLEAEMTKPQDLERTVEQVMALYGRLDALVCNAGYALLGPVDSFDSAQIRDQYLTNTVAPADLSRLVIPIMKNQNNGAIVFVSSIVGRIGLAGFGIYASSKWALEGLAESLALELDEYNIRVRLIEPSGVNTTFWTSLKRGEGRAWQNGEIGRVAHEPEKLHHGISPEAVAEAVFISVTNKSRQLRYPLGQTKMTVIAKRFLSDRLFHYAMRRMMR